MAENLLADLMGSLLIVAPAVFGIVFAYWLYKKLCKISLFRQSREDDEALLRRMEMADAGEAEADSYQKLRQIYRDIQAGAKAFLAAEYRMCVMFIAVFGAVIAVLVSNGASGFEGKVGFLTAFAFVAGGATSMISGYIGMMVATYTNARCCVMASITPDSMAWKESFNAAFRGGGVMGFALSGLGLLVMYFLMLTFSVAYSFESDAIKLFECIAGLGSAGARSPCSAASVVVFTPRRRMSARIWRAKSSPAFLRTTRVTRRRLPITWVTTLAMLRVWVAICLALSLKLRARLSSSVRSPRIS